MSLMKSIQTGKTVKPPRIFIYGGEGAGKSTWASQAPSPIFIQTEDGLGEIEVPKFPLVPDFKDFMLCLTALRDEEHEYKTLVIDSADWLEQLIFDEVCRESGVRTIEKACGGYGKGYSRALDLWRNTLSLLEEIRNKRNIIIIWIAHAKIERFEDPMAPAYDRYAPRLHKSAVALLSEWCDCIGFVGRRFRISGEESNGRKIATSIGADGGERYLKTDGDPSCVAKSRYKLPSELPLKWDAFLTALLAGRDTQAKEA